MPKKIGIILGLLILVSIFTYSLTKSSVIDELLAPLNLHQGDLGIEFISLPEDEFLLKKTIGFLQRPLSLSPYISSLSAELKKGTGSLEQEIRNAAYHLELTPIPHTQDNVTAQLSPELIQQIKEQFKDTRTSKAILDLLTGIVEARAQLNHSFKGLSDEELELIHQHLCLGLLTDYRAPRELSKWELQWFKEDLMLTAGKVDLQGILDAGMRVAKAIDSYLQKSGRITGDVIFQLQSEAGQVIIGGPGDNEYRLKDAALIIDPGGNDKYFLRNPLKKQVCVIIDYEGNDEYLSETDFSQAGAAFGLSFLIDRKGDDTYRGKNFSQGCAVFGVGILMDEEGNDTYSADTMVQGAGAFGIGLLIDLSGNDKYNGALMAQGFGFTKGLGGIVELEGDDVYLSGNRYPDMREPEGAFRCFSQGFGYGMRNYSAGGIGILADYQGNDTYQASYFAQGASYWLSLGILYDQQGNDRYKARRYSQGAGIHLSAGCLLDCSGDDSYLSWGVSQGCGHDYSPGLLIDMQGDDRYVSNWLSQGAGSQSGMGLLVDIEGDDSYQGQTNTQGIGVYDDLRDYNSLGLLLELQGRDTYSSPGREGPFWQAGGYGGGLDVEKAGLKTIKELGRMEIKDNPLEVQRSQMPRELPPIIAELERSIPGEKIKKEIAETLSKGGPQIIELLLGYIDIKDTITARTVEEALKNMGKPAAIKLGRLLKEQEFSPGKVCSILYVLGELKEENSLGAFLEYLSSDKAKVRLMSARGIKNLKARPPLEKVLPLTKEKSAKIRKFAAEILGKFGKNKQVHNVLLRLLKDDNFNVRLAAAAALKNSSSAP